MQISLDMAMERTFSVGELCQLVTDVVSLAFPHDVWVEGEIRGLTRAQSGHVYFDLVDPSEALGRSPDALLPVVLFESRKHDVNRRIKRSGGGMRIDDGVAVRIRAQPQFYGPKAQVNLRMTDIDPAYTLGQLAASKERLLRLLAEEGLVGANARVEMPLLPLRVGLVTAAGSAAAADFVAELGRSRVAFEVVVATTPVQGVGAPHRIAAAIRACQHRQVDVIAVVRGGGAKTDLAAFDDEVVARAIAGSRVPVLTGIGHEVDTAVADQVAHLALKTPTACAAHIAELVTVAERAADAVWEAVTARAADQLGRHDQRLADAAGSVSRAATDVLRRAEVHTVHAGSRARTLIMGALRRADDRLTAHAATAAIQARYRLRTAGSVGTAAAGQLARAARGRLRSAAVRVDRADERARLLDPAHALARGWSITTDRRGRAIRSVHDVSPGTLLTTRVADGHILSTVDEPESALGDRAT